MGLMTKKERKKLNANNKESRNPNTVAEEIKLIGSTSDTRKKSV
jgi:hypothetical protein